MKQTDGPTSKVFIKKTQILQQQKDKIVLRENKCFLRVPVYSLYIIYYTTIKNDLSKTDIN